VGGGGVKGWKRTPEGGTSGNSARPKQKGGFKREKPGTQKFRNHRREDSGESERKKTTEEEKRRDARGRVRSTRATGWMERSPSCESGEKLSNEEQPNHEGDHVERKVQTGEKRRSECYVKSRGTWERAREGCKVHRRAEREEKRSVDSSSFEAEPD